MPTIIDFPLNSTRFFLISPPEGVDASGLEVAIRTDGQGVGFRVHGQVETVLALSGSAAQALAKLILHTHDSPSILSTLEFARLTMSEAHIEEIAIAVSNESNMKLSDDEFNLAT